MPRKRISKDIHTRPDMAGPENIPQSHIEKNKESGDDGLMESLTELFSYADPRRPRKSAWEPEQLFDTIQAYFKFCDEKNLKPTKGGLRLYIGVSRSQYYAWQTNSEVYGDVSNLINEANEIMENQYVNRGEKYPTFNMFLLKSKHGYEDKSTIEVKGGTQEEVAERIKQLGLKDGE